jgi:hypothetical protein
MLLHVLLFLCSFSFFQLYSEDLIKNKENPKIDIVYLWVDGSDPVWQAIKNAHIPSILDRITNILHQSPFFARVALLNGTTDNRFRNNNELKYSLRSVWQYAPFVNHIYIVTMGQRPEWLADHPLISIVDHTEIFKDTTNLPTFNSQAIESNIHRISGLSDYFIYFNDDFFLGAPTKESHFFKKGKMNVLFEKKASPQGESIEGETAYRKAWRNTNAFLNNNYYQEERYFLRHSPYALRKSYIERFDQEFPEIFAKNSTHKFRSSDDYNVTNGLLHYYWKYSCNGIFTKSFKNIYVSIKNDSFFELTQARLERIIQERPVSFCLEDNIEGECEKTQALLADFLETYFPLPAPWEKTDQ